VLPNIIPEPSAVPFTRSAFSRLLEPLDRRVTARAVREHDGDHGVGSGAHAWTCERHLKTLLFAQFTGLKSLREIVHGLEAQSAAFYHLNLRAPCRTTLSDANAARPAAVFRDIAQALVPLVARTLRRESDALIRLLDSSPLPLKGNGFAWAEHGARFDGLKLHLLHDPRQDRPVWFDVTSVKVDDVTAGRTVPLEPGATYVFDKGYTDYAWWADIIAAKAFFVTRRKSNAHRRTVCERAPKGAGILADRTLKIGHRRPRGGAPVNPLYEVSLREVVVARLDDEPLYLVTNDLARPADEIARLYKERWDIELMFKWLKQNLKIRSFLGRSENAVRIQIYVALIAFMLLRILHHTAARSFTASTTLLLARIKITLFSPFSLRVNRVPPPLPPSLRPPNPQACFAFR
jgi:putative transposase